MARFSQIVKGRLARHTTDLPLADGQIAKVAVRVLLDEDDDEIETKALAYAKKRGLQDPTVGDPIYDRGVALHTLLLACSDPDSPDAAPVPFFDTIEQIQQGLDGDRIAWLLSVQRIHQDRCSPRKLRINSGEAVRLIFEAATSEDERPFVQCRPGLQWSLMQLMASLLFDSHDLKSLTSLVHERNGGDSSSSRSSSPEATPDGALR